MLAKIKLWDSMGHRGVRGGRMGWGQTQSLAKAHGPFPGGLDAKDICYMNRV